MSNTHTTPRPDLLPEPQRKRLSVDIPAETYEEFRAFVRWLQAKGYKASQNSCADQALSEYMNRLKKKLGVKRIPRPQEAKPIPSTGR